MKLSNVFKLVAAIAVSELAAIIGSLLTISQIPTWYAGLEKAPINPPSWVFGPVWSVLYILMAIAAFLVWRSKPMRRDVRTALNIFIAQLILNVLWSALFFGLHSPVWALVDIVALWVMIVWTMAAFYKVSRTATYLLVPYLAWVSFAAYLNLEIWLRN